MSPIDNLEQRLAAVDQQFKAAPSEPGYGDRLPEPGTYQGILRTIDFFEAKATGQAYLKLVFEVVNDPAYNGLEVEVIHPLEPDGPADFVEMKYGFLKKDLKTLGIDVDSDEFSLTQVRPGSPIWDDVLDVPVEFAVVESKKVNQETGKPWKNVYLNERLGGPLPADVPNTLEPQPQVDPADDLPF